MEDDKITNDMAKLTNGYLRNHRSIPVIEKYRNTDIEAGEAISHTVNIDNKECRIFCS